MITLLFSFILAAQAKTIKIAVVDSGIDTSRAKVKMCSEGHKDFTGEGLIDVRGHGSVVSTLIDNTAKNEDYCQIIVKYSSVNDESNTEYLLKALNYVSTLNVDYVNISGGGWGSSAAEKKAILNLLNKGVVIIAAAGNDGRNLDVDCSYFPACYDARIVVVGALDESGKIYSGSNYGKVVDFYFSGVNVVFGKQLYSGTSMSTASISGKLIVLKKKFREVWQEMRKKQ